MWKKEALSHEMASIIIFVTAYWGGMTVTVLSIVRYMIPVMGLLFIAIPGALRNRGVRWHKA